MGKKKSNIELPVAPLADLMAWWQSQDLRGIIIGGLAASLLGRPRVTRDIDALVLLDEEEWPALVESAGNYGFAPRLEDTLAFAQETRVLLLRHVPTGIDVDIAVGSLPFEEEAVARAIKLDVAGTSTPLSSPEDLIIMKTVSHRERDWLDIEGLLLAHPHLDLDRVRRWVRVFAEALETPELCADLERRLEGRSSQKPKRGKRKR